MTAASRYVIEDELGELGVRYSDRHLRRLEASGDFPARVKLGERKSVWVRAEVEAWLRSKEEARAMSCWVCDAPASRVMDGRQCCSVHTHLSRHPDDPPPAPCAAPGCGADSNRAEYGHPLCVGHGPADLPPRSF